MDFPSQIFKWLGFATYSTSPPSPSPGDVVPLQCDSAGRLITTLSGSSVSVTVNQTQYTLDSQNTLAHHRAIGAARLLGDISGFNHAGATRYVCLFDAAADQPDTTSTSACLAILEVPAGCPFTFTPPGAGLALTTGLTWVCSSTRDTITHSADLSAYTFWHS